MNEQLVTQQVPALQIDFANSNVIVEDTPDYGKRLVIIHPCGIAATVPFPQAAARQVGAQLMGSGRIALASEMPT